MPTIPSLFYQLLDRDSIYDSLFDHSSPAAIFRAARTCRLAQRAATDYNSRAFDILKHLKRFFADPLEFRVMQAHTGTVISGSNALQFLDRDIYPDSDLDLYVEPAHTLAVCEWIAYHAGYDYRFVPTDKQKAAGIQTYEAAVKSPALPDWYSESADSSNEAEGFRVVNFSSPTGPTNARKIQIISKDVPPMAAILSFHSTVVMNAITYRAAYSFFPSLTFEKRCLISCKRSVETTLGKYYVRGWDKYPMAGAGSESMYDPVYGAGRRWANDDRSWVIQFDISLIEEKLRLVSRTVLPLKIDPFSANSFNVAPRIIDRSKSSIHYGIGASSEAEMVLRINFQEVSFVRSEYSYTICRGLDCLSKLFTHRPKLLVANCHGLSEVPESTETKLFLFNKLYKPCHRCNDAAQTTKSYWSSSSTSPDLHGNIDRHNANAVLSFVDSVVHESEDLNCSDQVLTGQL